MEYNDTKGSRRNRGGRRRRRGQGQEEAETMKADEAERNGEEEHDERDDDGGESSSNPLPEPEIKSRIDDAIERADENAHQDVRKKNTKKKENASKSKVASRGRKQKVRCQEMIQITYVTSVEQNLNQGINCVNIWETPGML
ncbi:hypothetical protein BUALT_Bualt02G0158700 [Buddleja alternifolia]|uniref:Uncharacterized protein n=1 Tax=Buddleja alternifolia TaxID=168488 RepID=A0AAV6Y7N9_9LAMI|nr:hypothetical protein BUALT_Bualt02G0158700 [Buddleja alternifolia]